MINRTGRRAKTKYNTLCKCGHRETQHFKGKFNKRMCCKKLNCDCQQFYDRDYLKELPTEQKGKLYKVVTPEKH